MTELDRWPTLAPIVLHSFDGTAHLADWAKERGCFVGIGGLATRRSAAGVLRGTRAYPGGSTAAGDRLAVSGPAGVREPAQCSCQSP